MTAAPAVHALDSILSYHAHVYYDPALTRAQAETLRQHIAERFVVQLGRWHEVPLNESVLPLRVDTAQESPIEPNTTPHLAP